ncbi:uncharacterized protein M6B38_282890 [Iris pallida]|uniref:Expp1 protein n=1 Tax=Iris pallida TaxID=29817 RepID=A0AAX6I152_IRIPA|nr:Uncharacterized protein M6B38_219345 [Iris pallida]KAJ6846711.1 uncharacterized protein M6B38_282890 [Iris pallida]
MARSASTTAAIMLVAVALLVAAEAGDTNHQFSPCGDSKIQRRDGFSFGIAFSTNESFFSGNTQFSPCDRRLPLSSGGGAQLAVFRPKVDEISLLTINTTTNTKVLDAGFMVAFAGRRFAARSPPTFVGNNSYVVTGFTLVLEFKKGTLQNFYWKTDGCSSCSGKSDFVCLNKQECAIKTSSCKTKGGSVDCSIGIQLAFSGTDKHDAVLNSWFEVSNLRQYSLYGLYSNLKGSLTDQFNSFF